MPRSNNAVASRARRKKVLKMAKGYYGARKNVWTVAKNAVEKGLLYAYIGRKLRKRQFRSLWIQRINAGARQHGMSYSVFMGKMSKAGIELNRDRAMRGEVHLGARVFGVREDGGRLRVDEKLDAAVRQDVHNEERTCACVRVFLDRVEDRMMPRRVRVGRPDTVVCGLPARVVA